MDTTLKKDIVYKPFEKVLFGFAFSPSLHANLLETIRLSLFFKARLILIHVGKKTAAKEAQVKRFLAESENQPKDISIYWEKGNPVRVLLNACAKYDVDLLLLGALKRENVFKFYLGSIARKLTRKAKCSVLLMLNPSVERIPCNHIVVNALENPKTNKAIAMAFYTATALGSSKITLVEEISTSGITLVDDDASLEKAMLQKEDIQRKENVRVHDMVAEIPEQNKKNVQWYTQGIFGRRGYSISHYAQIVRADLLVMNGEVKRSFFKRLFLKDIEYILAELPTNVLIVQSNSNE